MSNTPTTTNDAAIADKAAGARDAAHQGYVDHLNSAWHGGAPQAQGDAEAAQAASVAAAEAKARQVADRRPDGHVEADQAHAAMVARLQDAWKSR